jgi:hypothetical protein
MQCEELKLLIQGISGEPNQRDRWSYIWNSSEYYSQNADTKVFLGIQIKETDGATYGILQSITVKKHICRSLELMMLHTYLNGCGSPV